MTFIVPTDERETPFTHYGVSVKKGSVEDAFRAAGLLDWNIRMAPMSAVDPNTDQVVHADDRYATLFDKPEGGVGYLGTNGLKYCPIPNEDLISLASGILDDSDLVADSVGHYRDRRRVFVNFRLPESIEIDGSNGGVNAYLFLASSHDGSIPLTAKVLLMRMSCKNQLNSIFGDRTAPTVKMRHTSGARPRLQDIREALGLSFRAVGDFSDMAKRWLDTEVTSDSFAQIMEQVFPYDEDSSKAAVTRAINLRDSVEEVYTTSPTLQGLQRTAWGVINALVEHDDWGRTSRSSDARALGMLEGRDRVKRGYASAVANVLGRHDLLV